MHDETKRHPADTMVARLYHNGPGYPLVGELFLGSEFIRVLTQPEVNACRELLERADREPAANEAS